MNIKILVLLIIISLSTKAQFLDTLKHLMHSKPSIDARLESRWSFINNTPTKVSGVRLGLSFRRKLKIGIGYSWLDRKVSEKLRTTDAYGNSISVDNYLKFGYICYYADFVFYKTKRWQLSIPIQAGTGLYWRQYSNGTDLIKSKKRFLLLYEPGISTQYKITKWLGLGADVCVRLTLRNTNYLSNTLNSPVYAGKILIWFDQIYYMIAPKSKITKKYGPASW